VRRDKAYVWQIGRFDGDLEFWKTKLSVEEEVCQVDDGKALRFYLITSEDFDAFSKALSEWRSISDTIDDSTVQ